MGLLLLLHKWSHLESRSRSFWSVAPLVWLPLWLCQLWPLWALSHVKLLTWGSLVSTSPLYVIWFFWDRVSQTICPGLAILLISASRVASIIGMSHWRPAEFLVEDTSDNTDYWFIHMEFTANYTTNGTLTTLIWWTYFLRKAHNSVGAREL
jgi:hypothetical protein